MQQPPDFEVQDKSIVYQLNKAICGLKQASRAWFDCLKAALKGLGSYPAGVFPLYSHSPLQPTLLRL